MRALCSPKECSFLYRVIHPLNFVRNVYETPTNPKDLLCKEETSNCENEQTFEPKQEPTYYQIKSVNTLTNSKTILRLSFKPGKSKQTYTLPLVTFHRSGAVHLLGTHLTGFEIDFFGCQKITM
jgi:hypothetical protein